MKFCSKCGKTIWFWQNRWSLGVPNKKPSDFWHTGCAKFLPDVIEENGMHLDDINRYLKSITCFTKESENL